MARIIKRVSNEMCVERTGLRGRASKEKEVDAGNTFFASLTLDQLAERQGVRPLEDPEVLLGGWPDDEDLDAFLEETYQSRSA
jgi:hypothetical protein